MVTLGELARERGAYLKLSCQPCPPGPRTRTFEPADLVHLFGGELTVANLKRRLACPGCGMPVDGEFRTLEVL